MTDWPWPMEPDEVGRRSEAVRMITNAACAEVGIHIEGDGRRFAGSIGPKGRMLARAQQIVFTSLGITYELVDLAEYERRVVALMVERHDRKKSGEKIPPMALIKPDRCLPAAEREISERSDGPPDGRGEVG